MKQLDDKLFTVLAEAAERRMSEFNALDVINMAWACATVKQSDYKLLTASVQVAERLQANINS